MKLKLLFVCIIITVSATAQKISSFGNAIQFSRDSITKLMQRAHIPGLSVTVSVNGKTVWSEGFGYADIEHGVPVYPSKTKFRIGSISKSLTSAGLGKLYEQHKIILDSSIYYYLPDYPKLQYRPTVRQVAGHIGGIRHYKGNEFLITQHYKTVSDGLEIFKHDPLESKPGTTYQYSSHGFNLLSAVMEKAASGDFLTFMEKEVINPLELRNTVPDVNDSIILHRTGFYEFRNGKWVNGAYVDNSYKWAGGGFISTSEDICKFGNALLTTAFLKKETIKLFTTPQILADGSLTGYGMGFANRKDALGKSYFGHSGGSVGGTSNLVIYPEEKIVVAILTNLSGARLREIASKVAHLYMDSKKTDLQNR